MHAIARFRLVVGAAVIMVALPAAALAADATHGVSRAKHSGRVSLHARHSQLRFTVSLSAPRKATCLVLVSHERRGVHVPDHEDRPGMDRPR